VESDDAVLLLSASLNVTEYRGIRYTIRIGIERGQWLVAIHPEGVEVSANKNFVAREDAEFHAQGGPWRRERAFAHHHTSSPAIWGCGACVTARWAAIRRTGTTNADGNHVINRRMNTGDAMMLGRGRCREGGAQNNCGGKRNFYLAQHFCIS
jgi:hypothetical protein